MHCVSIIATFILRITISSVFYGTYINSTNKCRIKREYFLNMPLKQFLAMSDATLLKSSVLHIHNISASVYASGHSNSLQRSFLRTIKKLGVTTRKNVK